MGTPAQATAPAGWFHAPHGRGITPATVIMPVSCALTGGANHSRTPSG
jgi:hypothetical protein